MLSYRIKKNHLLIAYKLLGDAFFLLLAFFLVALIADGLVPGIISDHVSFLRMTFLTALVMAGLYLIGAEIGIELENRKSNKKTIIFISIIAALVVFNSLLKLNIILVLFILAVVLVSFFLTYKNFFPEK